MSLYNNSIPKHVRRIHFIAVCGTGMGALACMLKDLGFEVTGSDQNIYPPMSDFLNKRAIAVFDGFHADHLSHKPDLIVVGNAVRKDNPEALRMVEAEIPFCSMPQAVNHFISAGKEPVVVVGTHGKTTLSSLIAWLFHHAGLDPTFIIGGILENFGTNYRLGHGNYIIIEGDEYDTAFFDKKSKFLHYHPRAAVLTGIEFDHADIFHDIDHVKAAFDAFIGILTADDLLLAFDGSPHADALIYGRNCRIMTYGSAKQSCWRLGPIDIRPPWSDFLVYRQGGLFGSFSSNLMGKHNLYNALAAIAVAEEAGIPLEKIAEGLRLFSGVKRRQQVRGVVNGITVMDDFAHHPTAVCETIQAVKPFYPNGRLIAVFEPRTNTSMRAVFQDVYPESFDGADLVCIRKPPLLQKIPEAERFSSEKLVEDLKRRGKNAHYFPDTDSIIDFLLDRASSGDLILIMSNGGFDNIHERLLESL